MSIGVKRGSDDVAYRPNFHDPPGIHDGDAIRRFGDHFHVVRDEHDRGAALATQPLQELNDLAARSEEVLYHNAVGSDRADLTSVASATHMIPAPRP